MTYYKRLKKPITQKDVDRFWTHVDIGKPNECWEWKLAITKYGYGLFAAGNTLHRPARFAFINAKGLNTNPISTEYKVTVACGNKKCCNPKHLKRNNQQDVWDKIRKDGNITVGSKHKMSKFKEADIIDIRNRYKPQSATDGYKPIGDDYGVTPGCIRDIIIRKTWQHV
jgi:hypothetical protein